MQLASKTLGQGFLAQKSIGNDITGYPYFHGDDPLRRYQHLLKQYPYYYSGGDLDGYLYDHSRNFGTPRLPREAYVGVFDGTTNYSTLGRRLTSGSPTELSCTAWVKTEIVGAVSVASEYRTETTTNRMWQLGISNTAVGKARVVLSSDGSYSATRKEYEGTTTINDGRWHHIAFTFSSGVLLLYIDGVAESVTKLSDADVTALYDGTVDFAIGAATVSTTPVSKFPGSLSDVRIYSTAKSADEIAAIYSGDHLNPDTTGLLAAYALEEESGTLLYDWSGNGNDLTVAGTMTNFWDTDADKTWSYVDSRGHSPVGPNLLTYSEQFDNAAWQVLSTAVTANTELSPSGELTADTLTNVGNTNTEYRIVQSVTSSAQLCFSVYIKAGTHQFVQFRTTSATSGFVNFNLDLITASASTATGSIVDVGSGWRRCTAVFAAASITSVQIQLVSSLAATRAENWAPTGTISIHLGGAQLQTGTEATTYSKTTATANPAVAIKPKQIGQSATYTGRTTYPGLSYVSTLQGDGSTVYVDCGATAGLVDNVKLWFYNGTTINSASSGRGLFCHNYSLSGHDIGLGQVTSYSSSEVISIQYNTGRTMVENITIAPGWHTLELDWNGSHYDIILDDVVQTVTIGTAASHVAQFEMTNHKLFIRTTLSGYFDGQIANFQFTVADGTTYTIVPERTGDRIWKMGTDGSAVLVDSAIAGTLTNVHQSAALPVEDWHLKHGGHVGTNLAQQSTSLNITYWTSSEFITAIENNAISPDGTQNATRFLETIANANHRIGREAILTLTSGSPYTASVFVKGIGRSKFALIFVGAGFSGTSNGVVHFDIDSESTTTGIGQVEAVGDGWYRLSASTLGTASSAGGLRILVLDDAGNISFTGDITKGFYAWGAQFVQGTEALPYTPTTASSATDVHVPANYNNVAPYGEAPYYAPGVLMETRKLAPRGGVDSVFANTINLESTYTYGNERASIDPIDTKRKVVLEPIGERDFVAYKEAIPLAGSFVEENLTLNHQYTRGEDYAVVGPELTFSRASGATMFNSAGTLVWAPENLLTYSEDFSNAAWSKTTLSVTSNAGTAPDGTLTADRIQNTATSGQIYQTATSADGLETIHIYVKGENGGFLRVFGSTASFTDIYGGWFDLTTGAWATTASAGSGVLIGTDVEEAGNGWYRISVTGNSSVNTPRIVFYLTDSDGTSTRSTTTTALLWGAQLYRSPNASSTYIPTTTAAVYGMRTNSHVYESGAWTNKGLLVEGSATNLLTYSQDLSNVIWTKTDITLGATTLGPDGISTVPLCTEGTAGTSNLVQNVSVSSGATVTFSVAIKYSNQQWFRIRIVNGADAVNAWIDVLNGVVGAIAGSGTGIAGTLSVSRSGNGFYRFAMTGSVPSATSYNVTVFSALANSSFTRVNNSAFYATNLQVETGSQATSYIPTTTAAVTRSADVATIGGSDFTGFYNASEGTWAVEGNYPSTATNDRSLIYSRGGGSVNNSQRIGHLTGGNIFSRSNSGGSADGTVQLAFAAANTQYRIANAYALNDLSAAINGTLGTPDTSLAVPVGIDELLVGLGHTGVYLNGHIKSIKYYTTRKPNAFLKGITG